MRMMKAVLLVTALVVSASAAKAAGTMTFGLGGGVTLPLSDLKVNTKLGFNGGVYGDYWLKDDYAFGVDIAGNFLSGSDDFKTIYATTAYPDPKLKFTIINFGVHGKWVPPMKDSPVSPWITYGVGMYNSKAKFTGVAVGTDKSTNKFGFNGGVGLDFKGNASMKPGVDAKYHYVMTDNKATSYITAGVHVTFSTTGK